MDLPHLEPEEVYAIFDQAMAEHPYMPGEDNGMRPRKVMLEAARLITKALEAKLAEQPV